MTQIAQNSPAAIGWSKLPAAYAIPAQPPSLAEAREYCARLARSHYENFSVASWFLPRRLRQHFFNVYAYCRISDDLGDEVGDAAASLALLDEWQSELNACYEGTPKHPVFVALEETVGQFEIPKHEFSDLLIAFRRDQTITRFDTFDDVAGILPLLGESGRPPCALFVRISRRRAAAAFRFHLHRAATGQFLAGRERRLQLKAESICRSKIFGGLTSAKMTSPAARTLRLFAR